MNTAIFTDRTILYKIREAVKQNTSGVVSVNYLKLFGESAYDDITIPESLFSKIGNMRGIQKGYTERCSWSSYLRIVRKPCKQFKRLNQFLLRHTDCGELDMDAIKIQYIHGKGNNEDISFESWFCHDSNKCNEILTWLRTNKALLRKVSIEIKR